MSPANVVRKVVDGISYLIQDEKDVRQYVLDVVKNEWDPDDFTLYGDDLYQSKWKLKVVPIDKIQGRPELLNSSIFQTDLKNRIVKQQTLITRRTPLLPLILRDSDFLIFDGYARIHTLRKLGVKKTLAYVGSRK